MPHTQTFSLISPRWFYDLYLFRFFILPLRGGHNLDNSLSCLGLLVERLTYAQHNVCLAAWRTAHKPLCRLIAVIFFSLCVRVTQPEEECSL